MPSIATCSSVYSMPFSAHVAASSSLIAREASEMSVSPAQNRANPSPVPGPSTEMFTSGSTSLNSSWTRTEIGSTVDEPEITMSPDRPPPSAGSSAGSSAAGSSAVSSSSPPQAASTRAAATAPAAARFPEIFTLLSPLQGQSVVAEHGRALNRARYESKVNGAGALGERTSNSRSPAVAHDLGLFSSGSRSGRSRPAIVLVRATRVNARRISPRPADAAADLSDEPGVGVRPPSGTSTPGHRE